MIIISRSVFIPDEEISLTGVRAQGAGGQHVNKASTAIHLRFDIKPGDEPRSGPLATGCADKRIDRSAEKPPGDATDSGVKRAATCLQGAKVLSQSAAWESSSLRGVADGWNGL